MNVRPLTSLPSCCRRSLEALPCFSAGFCPGSFCGLGQALFPSDLSNLQLMPVLVFHIPCFICHLLSSLLSCLHNNFIFLFPAHPNSSLAPSATGSSSATPLQRILSSTFSPGRSLLPPFSCPRSLPVSVLSCEYSLGLLLFCSRQVACFTSPLSSALASFGMGPCSPSLLALSTLAQENLKIPVLR